MATSSGHSKWITGDIARKHVHRLRGKVDSILVGQGTVVADDPSLNARIEGLTDVEINQPIRIILDPDLTSPHSSKVLNTPDLSPVYIFCSDQVSKNKQNEFLREKTRVIPIEETNGKLNLKAVLQELAQRNTLILLVEGGPQVHTSFLENNLVNELFIYIAPKIVGGKDAPTFYMGQGASTMEDALHLDQVERLELGADTLIHGILS